MNLPRIISIMLLICLCIGLNGQQLVKKKNDATGPGDAKCSQCKTLKLAFHTTDLIPFGIWANETVTSSVGTIIKDPIPNVIYDNNAAKFNCKIYEYTLELSVCCENCGTKNEYCPQSVVVSFDNGLNSCLFEALEPHEYFDLHCLDEGEIDTSGITFDCDFEFNLDLCCEPEESINESATIDTIPSQDSLLVGRSFRAFKETNSTLILFPNPATDFIEISNLNKGDQLKLLDRSGRIINSININSDSSTRLELDDLESGLYFIQRRNEIKKLIKL